MRPGDEENGMLSRISRLFGRGAEGNGDGYGCDQVRGTLSSDFIDDELEPEERNRLIAHLQWCGLCLAFINTLKATVRMLSSSEPPKPPPNLNDRIHANLSQDDSA
jgi:hypothetical protein